MACGEVTVRRQGKEVRKAKVKKIELTQGYVALVDDTDFEQLNQFNWFIQKGYKTNYAVRHTSRATGHKTIYMHREIMNAPGGLQVDHVDRDGLNNQRMNLRLCSNAENHFNQIKQQNRTSQYKGVYLHTRGTRWVARIKVKGKHYHLACFKDEVEAARCYDEAAIKHFGKFARLNFPARKVAI